MIRAILLLALLTQPLLAGDAAFFRVRVPAGHSAPSGAVYPVPPTAGESIRGGAVDSGVARTDQGRVDRTVSGAADLAQPVPPAVRRAGRNACQLRWKSDAIGWNVGSACYIGNGFYLTARHCVEGARPAPRGTVTFPDGRTATVAYVAGEKRNGTDVALLYGERFPGGVRITSQPPPPGARVYPLGYSRRTPHFFPWSQSRIRHNQRR